MSGPFDAISDSERAALREEDQPDWIAPMLATLTDDRFSDPDWIYERKLDGERCLAFRKGRGLRLLSRNRKRLDDTYPEIADVLQHQACGDFVLDGEIVALERGLTSFSRLQQRMRIRDARKARRSPVAVHYYVFDLLHLDRRDTTKLPLRTRKGLLRRAIAFEGRLRLTPHRNEDGEAYLEEACGKGWEGLIAKRADAPYEHHRSRSWLKFKCVARQEFVIAGFTDPKGERTGFGALVLAYHDDGDLVCAGKVGTGFDDETLESLGSRMRSRERKTSPIDRGDAPSGAVHWITPELVAEVAFTEWTSDGRLRHPRFLGLRRDKAAADVVRERPEATS